MECEPKNIFGLFGSLYFAGVVISSLILPRLSDIYGRRLISILSIFLHIFAGCTILNTKSLTISLIANFLMGIAMSGRAFVGWAWMVEHMASKDAPWTTSIVLSLDAASIFMASLWFQYISKDYTIFYGLPLIILAVVVIYRLFQSETPKYYYSIANYD